MIFIHLMLPSFLLYPRHLPFTYHARNKKPSTRRQRIGIRVAFGGMYVAVLKFIAFAMTAKVSVMKC